LFEGFESPGVSRLKSSIQARRNNLKSDVIFYYDQAASRGVTVAEAANITNLYTTFICHSSRDSYGCSSGFTRSACPLPSLRGQVPMAGRPQQDVQLCARPPRHSDGAAVAGQD